MVGIVERLVPDELWELFQRVVPEAPSRPQGGGRRRHGDREVLAAIVFVATSGCTWQQLPPRRSGRPGRRLTGASPSGSKARVWAKLHRLVLDELGCPRRAGLVAVRDRLGEHAGPEKGDLTGPNPVDRGKYGSKIHLITERTGLPLSVGISGANIHDSQALDPLVRGIPPIRSRRGPRRRRPAKLHADKGYDYDHLRRWLRQTRHPPPHRPQGHRDLPAAGPPPLDHRTHHGLARRLPPPPPPLRTQGRPLPRLHQHRLHPHLLPQTHQMR